MLIDLTLNFFNPLIGLLLIFGNEEKLCLVVANYFDLEGTSVILVWKDADVEESEVNDSRGVLTLLGFVVH